MSMLSGAGSRIAGGARRVASSPTLRGWAQHELNMTEQGFLRSMGSFATNAGFHQGKVAGVDAKSVLFGNRIIAGYGKDQWGAFNKAGDLVTANSIEGVMELKHGSAAWAAMGKNEKGFRSFMQKASLMDRGLLNTAFPLAMSVLVGAGAFADARRQGAGIGGAGLAAGGAVVKDAVFMRGVTLALTNPYAAIALGAGMAGKAAVTTVFNAKEEGNRFIRTTRRKNMDPSPAMYTQQAATMRQRAMMSIQSSRFNNMRALGGEATFSHMQKSVYGNTSQIQVTPQLGY